MYVISLMAVFFIGLVVLPQPVLATEVGNCRVKALGEMGVSQVPVEVAQRVRLLEYELRRDQKETEKAAAEVVEIKDDIAELRATMSFREKYLWRWLAKLLGADVEKIDNMRNLKAIRDEARQLLRREQTEDQTADELVVQMVDQWLRQQSPRFAQLREIEREMQEAVCAGGRCMTEIKEALSALDSAQTMEMIDMGTKSKGIAIMSHLSTSSANGEVRDIKPALENFKRELQDIKDALTLQEGKLKTVDDTLDFVFDMVFSGADFMSVFQLFALSGARSDVAQLKGQVETVQRDLDARFEKLQDNIHKLVCEVRSLCLVGQSEASRGSEPFLTQPSRPRAQEQRGEAARQMGDPPVRQVQD
jgi:hypothetical protein